MQFTGAEQPIGRLQTSTVRLRQPWVEGGAYEVALITSVGGTVTHEIPVATETPDADVSFYGLMALLGVYVGILPIALGMLWLPWIRRIPSGWLRALMALTVGLLVFLAIDATLEGFEIAGQGSQAFGGTALVLIGAVAAFLSVMGVGEWLADRRAKARRRRLRHAACGDGRGRHRAAQRRRRARHTRPCRLEPTPAASPPASFRALREATACCWRSASSARPSCRT